MTLLGVEKIEDDRPYLYSEWRLTYRIGWQHILNAAQVVYEYSDDPWIRVGDANGSREVTVSDPKEIAELEEMGWLFVCGTSQMVHAPVQITFYNQTDLVRVSVLSVNEEFSEADYKKFNLSMSQFMDSVELNMY
ncbi:MAG: hypothetical protein J6U75_00175 [Clostridia bacterium]|nr:hypothetical protein [Clostridia bacterium]MBO7549492.1 hypothetical protein [Clostridia bacterium]MBP5237926.1 hypothetical protein [Clostridia bacterium]MBP5657278.1 hypothetical protein [Clostridia bacterium]